jgi:pimeloyl-ACP methyl ester carboxylesterase
MVPGFRTREGAFTPLYQKLTAGGRNGGHVYYVRDGAWFEDRACTQPLPAVPLQARVFEVVFPTRFVTPDEAATSLGHSLRAIRHASGARKLDVEGYSMGGLTARVYLDRGGTDIGRLLLLATPNRGAALANLGRHALRQGIDVAANLARLVPQELPALEWLVADSEKAANARLGELNRNWARQKSNVEAVMAVGTDFHTTLCNRWPGLTDGDGVVTTESMALPDGQLTVLREQGHKRHGRLNGDPEVYREMLAFFGWA